MTDSHPNALLDRDAQIAAAFFVEGAASNSLYTQHELGHYELIFALTDEAQFAAKLGWIVFEFTGGFPGVFEYEVAEPYGRWFINMVAEHGQFPNKDECQDELVHLTVKFVQSNLANDELAELHKLLKAETDFYKKQKQECT